MNDNTSVSEKSIQELAKIASTYAELLLFELQKRCVKNPLYSARAFAKSLDVSHGYLLNIINGVRKPSRGFILKTSQVLGLSNEEVNSFLIELPKIKPNQKLPTENNEETLQSWELQTLILYFSLSSDKRPETNQLTNLLKISSETLEKKIEKLLHEELLIKCPLTNDIRLAPNAKEFKIPFRRAVNTNAIDSLQSQSEHSIYFKTILPDYHLKKIGQAMMSLYLDTVRKEEQKLKDKNNGERICLCSFSQKDILKDMSSDVSSFNGSISVSNGV